ncbi:hypothetical protein Tco_0515980, partial [Tanacetum coccineum]
MEPHRSSEERESSDGSKDREKSVVGHDNKRREVLRSSKE